MTMKKQVLGKNGKRLPSVLKKALPLPPEDIRSVPHVRLNRVESPPVVSIGMSDICGIPIPWTQSPDVAQMMAAESRIATDKQVVSLADEVREVMRQDFDNIEVFIEQAFSRVATPTPEFDEIFTG